MYVGFHTSEYRACTNINCMWTYKLDHWQCEQRFHCSFSWPLILRPSALLLPIPLTAELISTFSNETGHLWKWGKQADRPWHCRLGILTSRNYFSYITDRLMWKVGSQRRQMEVNTEGEVCELSCIIACMRRQEVIWEEREKIHWVRKMEVGVVEYNFSKHTALKCLSLTSIHIKKTWALYTVIWQPWYQSGYAMYTVFP